MVSLSQIVTTENGIQEDILLALSYYLSYLIDNTKLSVQLEKEKVQINCEDMIIGILTP
jgi:hypothetical protein